MLYIKLKQFGTIWSLKASPLQLNAMYKCAFMQDSSNKKSPNKLLLTTIHKTDVLTGFVVGRVPGLCWALATLLFNPCSCSVGGSLGGLQGGLSAFPNPYWLLWATRLCNPCFALMDFEPVRYKLGCKVTTL